MIQLRNESGEVLCVAKAGYATDNGEPLLLDECQSGTLLQQIAGVCLQGDTPENNTWAFATSCDPNLQPPRLGALLDAEGRCLAPGKFEAGIDLVLRKCRA